MDTRYGLALTCASSVTLAAIATNQDKPADPRHSPDVRAIGLTDRTPSSHVDEPHDDLAWLINSLIAEEPSIAPTPPLELVPVRYYPSGLDLADPFPSFGPSPLLDVTGQGGSGQHGSPLDDMPNGSMPAPGGVALAACALTLAGRRRR